LSFQNEDRPTNAEPKTRRRQTVRSTQLVELQRAVSTAIPGKVQINIRSKPIRSITRNDRFITLPYSREVIQRNSFIGQIHAFKVEIIERECSPKLQLHTKSCCRSASRGENQTKSCNRLTELATAVGSGCTTATGLLTSKCTVLRIRCLEMSRDDFAKSRGSQKD
jgi:hypothetical protein